MLRYKLQITFMFVLYVMIQVNYCVSQESKTKVKVHILEEKCENNSCCDDFRKLSDDVECKKATKFMPYYLYIFHDDFTLDNIYELKFTDIEYLAARVFQGKHIRAIFVNNSSVTVDNKVFEGISALDEFYVQRSSIKVICLLIINLFEVFLFLQAQ